MNTISDVAKRVAVCTDCPLSKTRTLTVPGEGPHNAKIVFIGEGPGYHEDLSGRPFVGQAGRLLEQLLSSVGLKREEVFIANIVKCRPPSNRDPMPGEIAACRKYLDKQLELINPKLVVTLGRHSLGRFFPGDTIGKCHGKARSIDGLTVYPVYHPAAGLRSKGLKKVMVEDFKAIPGFLSGDNITKESESFVPEQINMFTEDY